MKEIYINIDSANKNYIESTHDNNNAEVYKIYILKNKLRVDLTGKTLMLGYVRKDYPRESNIILLNVTDAKNGEITLPITNLITKNDGNYACQIGIYGDNFLEQTATFDLIVKKNVIEDTINGAVDSQDFEVLKDALKTTQEYAEKLKGATGSLELQYATQLNDKLGKEDLESIQGYSKTVFNKLNSNLKNKIDHLTINTNDKITDFIQLGQQRIFGHTKYSPIIECQTNKNSSIEIVGNESTVEHIRISNTNKFPNKIGISVNTSQRHFFQDLIIEDFETGIFMPKSYYNYFADIFIRNNKNGMVVGNESNKNDWIGAMTLNAVRFNNNNIAFTNFAKENTRSLILNGCIFEGNIVSIKNYGDMIINNTYFGDQLQFEEDNSTPNCNIQAYGESYTLIKDCRLGLDNRAYTSKTITGVINFTEENATTVIEGGTFELSNNNLEKNKNGITVIYTSNNANNKLILDKVELKQSTSNANHNRLAFYLYNYSCLDSYNPIPNYVTNGTFNDQDKNQEFASQSDKIDILDTELVNPFGGKILEIKADGELTLKYKVPKILINKKMTLEFYVCQSADNYVRLNLTKSDSKEKSDVYFGEPTIKDGIRTPILHRIDFTPTKEEGDIVFTNVWNATKSCVLAGVILKEYKYKNFISQVTQ